MRFRTLPLHMTQNDFPRTSPANRYQITNAATDNQCCGLILMRQVTVRVKDGSRIQPVSKFERHELTAVKMSSQNQIVPAAPDRLPYSRIVRTQDFDITIRQRRRRNVRTSNRDHSIAMNEPRYLSMNPLPASSNHSVANPLYSDAAVVIAPNRKHGSDRTKRCNKILQLCKFRRSVNKIATEQYRVRLRLMNGFDHLPHQILRTPLPQVNVTHVNQATCIRSIRKSLVTNL